MKDVVFVAPYAMETTNRFARAVVNLPGVRVFGVFNEPPKDLRGFTNVVKAKNVLDPGALVHDIQRVCAGKVKPDRIVGILEHLQGPLAVAREALGVPGTDRATAERFRDKALMKEELRRHGLPCAAHARVTHPDQAWAFADRVGLPIILKPPDGAGSKATYRVNNAAELKTALGKLRPSPQRPTLAEEFLQGHEYSFETLTVGGQVMFHSIGRYYPGPLEVVENPHLQWVCVLPREIRGPEFDDVRAIGARTVRDLGLSDGMTHMEWFRRSDGRVAIGEIAARPPGAQIVKLMSYAHDTDFFHHWANAVVHGRFEGPWQRKHAVGVAFLRGPGQGRVKATHGLEKAQHIMGKLVVESKLPVEGAPKSDSYEGDGYVIVRHQDTEVVKASLLELIKTVSVEYA